MTRRRRRKYTPTYVPPWEISSSAIINGRNLSPGTEVSIRGARGRFRFIKRVVNEDGVEWLDFWGGAKKHEAFRSFYPDRVRTVHRIKQTPQAMLAARQDAAKEAALD